MRTLDARVARRMGWLLLAVALALGSAACGGDDGSSPGDNPVVGTPSVSTRVP